MKKKLSNQFLSNYFTIFLLIIIATILAFFMISFASGLISDTLTKNRYPASSIIKEDYTQIDTSEVVHNGGGVQVIDKKYRVVYSKGLDTIQKKQLSAQEFTELLIGSKDRPYSYDIMYQPKGDFWLIVTFPTSIRLDFSLVYNREATTSDFIQVGVVIVVVFIIYLLLLALITFVYSRITALRITIPLQKLCAGTRLLREGDYSVRVDLDLKNEFAELQNTFNDMAARIEHEMAFRQKSENNRRQLMLDISHDLKNPLSSILGYVELCMKKQQLTAQEQNEYLQVIQQNGHRANLLLSELLELAKIESPDFSLKLMKTDLCEYLRLFCGELIPLLERVNFKYEFDIPEKSIFAMMDTDQFNRILQNLADNVMRYNSEGTTVIVRLTENNKLAMIQFIDDGSGISDHLIEDIFKPFVRGDHSCNSKTGGSGLGLSIAKKIAEAHGGNITVLSDGRKGSVFIITISII